MRQIDRFLHRPRDDLVVQWDVGDQLMVGQEGFFYQGVAGWQIGFFADAFNQCVLLRVAILMVKSQSRTIGTCEPRAALTTDLSKASLPRSTSVELSSFLVLSIPDLNKHTQLWCGC